jgi:hypothetical protein
MGAMLARSMGDLDVSGGIREMGGQTLHVDEAQRHRIADALRQVFALGSGMTLLALAACAFLPRVDFTRPVSTGAGEQMIEAEMTVLEPKSEPRCVSD